MLDFIGGNLSTILVGAVVAAGLAAAVLKMRRDKKRCKLCLCAVKDGKTYDQ